MVPKSNLQDKCRQGSPIIALSHLRAAILVGIEVKLTLDSSKLLFLSNLTGFEV